MANHSFSLAALSRAVETRDSAAMRAFYADNARIRIIDHDHPPSRPQEIIGRGPIAAYFDDVCGRTMTHKIENGFVNSEYIAFTQNCAYPDGTGVFCSVMAELEGGVITRQTIVQAWDA